MKTLDPAALRQITLTGDHRHLDDEQRAALVLDICERVGISPETQPFAFLPDERGAVELVALKDCTNQLRRIYGISTSVSDPMIDGGLCSVRATATDGQRSEQSLGAVHIANKRGAAQAHAIMAAETKAKRRATLDFCGMGVRDESERVDMVSAATEEAEPYTNPFEDPSEDAQVRQQAEAA